MHTTNDDYASVVFDGTTQQTIGGAGTTCTFFNLTLSNNSSAGVVLGRNIALAGANATGATNPTLTISTNDVFDLSGYTCNYTVLTGTTGTMIVNGTLRLAGNTGGITGSNFPNNFTTLTMTGGTVEYNGSTPQTIASAPSYVNLVINNSSGVSLSAPTTVSGILTLTSGILTSTSANYSGSNQYSCGGGYRIFRFKLCQWSSEEVFCKWSFLFFPCR